MVINNMTRVIGDAILWPYIVIWASSQAKHECLSILKRIYRTVLQCQRYAPTEVKAAGNIEAIIEWKKHERASESALKKQAVGYKIQTSNGNHPPTRSSGKAKVERLKNDNKRNHSVFNVQESANKCNLHLTNDNGTQSLRASPILRDPSRCNYTKCFDQNEAKIDGNQSSTMVNKSTDLDLSSLLDSYSTTLNTSQSRYHGYRKDLPVSVKTKCNISKKIDLEMQNISDIWEKARIYRTALQCHHYAPTEAEATGNIEAKTERKTHERVSKSILQRQAVGNKIPASNRYPPPTRRPGKTKVETLQNDTKRNHSVFNVQPVSYTHLTLPTILLV